MLKQVKAVSPFALLINALLVLSFGIVILVDFEKASHFLQYYIAFLFLADGVSRSLTRFGERRIRSGLLLLLGYGLGAVSLFFFRDFYVFSISKIFGCWFLLTGLVRGLIFLQCCLERLQGRLRNGISALLSLLFGVSVLFGHMPQGFSVVTWIGLYFLLYAFTLLTDFFSELMRWDLAANKIKRRVRIALPAFMTAFIPGKLIDGFNAYFEEHRPEQEKLRNQNGPQGRDRVDLEVFVHLSTDGFGRFGHVDICYGETVYSYGCYDHHTNRFFGMVSDGTVAVCPREPYVRHCLTFENKTLVGFGLSLSPLQKQAVEAQLAQLTALFVPWESDLQRMEQGLLPKAPAPDPASQLRLATGAQFFKFRSGPFRTYFAVNTNCVQLADSIVGSSGIDLLSAGFPTPGAYCTFLNALFERVNTIVVQRTIYTLSKKRPSVLDKLS